VATDGLQEKAGMAKKNSMDIVRWDLKNRNSERQELARDSIVDSTQRVAQCIHLNVSYSTLWVIET